MAISDNAWPRDALPKGSELNGYKIDAVIGRVGFGITYRVTDAIDQAFALKECFPKQFCLREGANVLATDSSSEAPLADCLARFMREAKALKLLSANGAAGDGIVKVMTFFQANGTAYIVMEYLAGKTLDTLIKANRRGIPEAQIMGLLRPLLAAVGSVHEAGLLHRDIKPANIHLREDGRPVLIDFGATRGLSHGHTVTFTQIYSEGYAPVEQFAGSEQGPFSDIYALGATLYRAIGGNCIDSFTRNQAVLKTKPDPQVPAAEFGAGRYGPSLLRMIDAALAVAPEDRPQSVQDLAALLDSGAAAKTPSVAHTDTAFAATRVQHEPPSLIKSAADNAARGLGMTAQRRPLPPQARLSGKKNPRHDALYKTAIVAAFALLSGIAIATTLWGMWAQQAELGLARAETERAEAGLQEVTAEAAKLKEEDAARQQAQAQAARQAEAEGATKRRVTEGAAATAGAARAKGRQ